MDNKRNIENIDDQKMLDYLNNMMSNEERYAFEKEMNESAFLNDASEGLAHIESQQKINEYVEQLNTELKKITQKNNLKRKKKKLEIEDWILIAVILTVTLCVVAYYVIHLNNKSII